MLHNLLYNNLVISFCIITSILGNFKDVIFTYKLKRLIIKNNIKNLFLITLINFSIVRNYFLIGFVALLLFDIIKL